MTCTDDSLRSPYRAVRAITAPGDGPWSGMLTCLPSGERRVLVDADLLGADWGGWRAEPDGHVLAPLDVVRRQGGHDVELPVCTEAVDAYLARRRASPTPLTPEEAVTVGVSLLRGCTVMGQGTETAGRWWLAESGRPIFATDAAGPPLREGTIELLQELSRATPHASAWGDALAAVSAVRVSAAELDLAEVGLFSLAAPRALDLSPTTARMPGAPVRPETTGVIHDEPPRGLWETLARHVDADVTDTVSRVTTALWRRTRAPGGRRRAPLMVGAGIAAAVVSVGLMWPSGDGGSATAQGDRSRSSSAHPSVSESPSPVASASPQTTGPQTTVASEDLELVASALLVRSDGCGADADCRSELMSPGAAPARPVEVPAERREVVLLDDFGGVAVLRVDDTSGEAASQLIVIARRDSEWLLRDVYDAAQQP